MVHKSNKLLSICMIIVITGVPVATAFLLKMPLLPALLFVYIGITSISLVMYYVIFFLLNPYAPHHTSLNVYYLYYSAAKLVKEAFFILPYFGKFLKKEMYKLLGCKAGKKSMIFGEILEPALVTIGAGSVIGHNALVSGHSIEYGKIIFGKIAIGSNVTIGINAIIMPGVTIEDDAVISAGAVVPKNTLIKQGEIWGGIPAKCIKKVALEGT